MNKELLTTNTGSQEVDGKLGLQELKVVGEQNAVVENGVMAVAEKSVALIDANPTAVANAC